MRFFLLMVSLGFTISTSAWAVTVPNEFQANTPALASEVNANFDALVQAVHSMELRIQQLESELNASDRDGPSIQIDPPSDWTLDNNAQVTLQDASGLATRAARDWNLTAERFNSSLSMTPFLIPTTEATFNFPIINATDLLGEGVELLVGAQDVFGNFSSQSNKFRPESPVMTGRYLLDVPFESGALLAQYCPFETEMFVYPNSVVLSVDSMEVRGCFNTDGLCLETVTGSLVGTSAFDGSEQRLVGVANRTEIVDLANNQFFSPIQVWSGGSEYRLGSSTVATFFDETSRRLVADVEVHCFVNRFDDPATGCPIDHYESCDVDTFGPFRVEGTLEGD